MATPVHPGTNYGPVWSINGKTVKVIKDTNGNILYKHPLYHEKE